MSEQFILTGNKILQGTYTAPAAKSCTQRALAAALCIGNKSIIKNCGRSQDELAALNIIKSCGVIMKEIDNALHLDSSKLNLKPIRVNCGESGLSLRMFTPILATLYEHCSIDGDGSLRLRNHHYMINALNQAGANISCVNLGLPFTINKRWHPQSMVIEGSHGSQFSSGLLLAFSANNLTNATIEITNAVSKPYLALTLDVMQKFGMKLPQNENLEQFYFDNNSLDKNTEIPAYTVEGDWSNASFFAVGAAISGQLIFQNLKANSAQADVKIIDVLKMAGATVCFEKDSIVVKKNALHSFSFDATDCPDLFPPLVTLAAYCNGTSFITGVSRLKNKESNRALTLQSEFGKMGIEIVLQDNIMMIKGGKAKGATIHSHNDHRIAMACAIAGLFCNESTTIEHANATQKSYPDFFEHIQQLTRSAGAI